MSVGKKIGALLALAFLFSAEVQAQENLYTVEVKVDVTDVNAATARDKAMNSAYRQAFEKVVNRLTSSQDAASLKQMTDDQIVNFVQEIAVISEKASDVRYIADLQVKINKNILNRYLQEKEIQTAVVDRAKIVVIPVFREFEPDKPMLWENDNLWFQTWKQKNTQGSLIEISPIPDTAISRAEIDADKALVFDAAALQEVALNNNANDVYVADAFFDGIEGLKITLTSLKSDRAAEVIVVPGDRKFPQELLNRGMIEVCQRIENKIKSANLAQSKMQSTIAVIFNFEKLADWVKVQQQLKSIPYVKDIIVVAMGSGKVQFKMNLVGNDDRIWNAFRNKGFNLKQFDDFYLLEY